MTSEPFTTPDPSQVPASVRADGRNRLAVTRAGMAWAATVAALILLVFLIIFIVQNQDDITVRFIGLEGRIASGIALFIAAVGGGVLVAVAGAARILQLRSRSRRHDLTPPPTDRRA